MENQEVETQELPQLRGKALLDALFMRTMMANMHIFARKPGKHHKARAARAKTRIKARKQKRKAA